MSARNSSSLSQDWLIGIFGINLPAAASRNEWLAGVAMRAWRSAQRWLSQADREPQTAAEVLEYAFRIEHHSPSLAADLRAAALRHQGMTG